MPLDPPGSLTSGRIAWPMPYGSIFSCLLIFGPWRVPFVTNSVSYVFLLNFYMAYLGVLGEGLSAYLVHDFATYRSPCLSPPLTKNQKTHKS